MRLLVISLLLVACDPATPDEDAGVDAEAPWGDSDGDGISDVDEGRAESRDSDMDGQPDYLDLDSDGNGIPDATEGRADFDGDGIEDYADLDDDDDLVTDEVELAGFLTPPQDADGDGNPNFRDPDTDNDFILDGHEFGADTDGDGLFDHEDLDTDGDALPDIDEAGDDDLSTPPIDTDLDGIPDFRDLDSDGDGVEDRDEARFGTNPRQPDSDEDGVTDLIELNAGTDPLDPASSPLSRGEYFVVVSTCEAPNPEQLEVQLELTASTPAPVDVTVAFQPVAPEAADFFGSVVADPSGAGCAARTADGASYADAEQGDTLCFVVTSRPNESVDQDEGEAFRGELVLSVAGTSVELEREDLYYFVPPWFSGGGGAPTAPCR